jgi:hypothetical protein
MLHKHSDRKKGTARCVNVFSICRTSAVSGAVALLESGFRAAAPSLASSSCNNQNAIPDAAREARVYKVEQSMHLPTRSVTALADTA